MKNLVNITRSCALAILIAVCSAPFGNVTNAQMEFTDDYEVILNFVRANTVDVVAGVVAAGQLSVNEATWNTVDAAAITHIRHRYAQNHGMSLFDALMHLHGRRSLRPGRATEIHPRDARPWIGDLNADLREPRGWSERCTEDGCAPTGMPSWDEFGRPRWASVLATVIRSYVGNTPDPCRGPRNAITWGGPRVDHHRIERLLTRGFARVTCPGAANAFFSRE